MKKKLVFEVEISEDTLRKFWDKLEEVEVEKGTIDKAEDFELVNAFKDFFYQDFGMYDTLDLRDEVTVKLKSTEEEMIDQIVIAESKEDFDESARILGKIAKAYGYGFEMTGDGNWILSRESYRVEVLFDSGRGRDIPIWFFVNDKKTTEFVNPDAPRKIVEKCIAFMKEHKR